MEELEQSNSGVESAASPEPQTQSAEAPEASGEAQAQTSNTNEDKNLPFHEHPRFRELVEQKNQFAQQAQSFQKELAELKKQWAETQQRNQPETKDQLIERLKGIDPEFAERMQNLQSRLSKVDQFEAWQKQMEQERVQTRAVQTFNSLLTEHKVSKDMAKFYEAQIRAIGAQNPNLGVQDLPKVFKEVHDEFTKLFDARDRATRESYVTGKKQDASAPTSQPKGKAATPSAKQDLPKDPAAARQALIKRVLETARAGKDI